MVPRQQTILVVEDEPNLRVLYRSALSREGFLVEAVKDGLEALQRLAKETPDLIVLDLGLPGLRGESLLVKLAANPRTRNIPVIVVTDEAEIPTLRTRFVLRKPFKVHELVRAVERCLGDGSLRKPTS